METSTMTRRDAIGGAVLTPVAVTLAERLRPAATAVTGNSEFDRLLREYETAAARAVLEAEPQRWSDLARQVDVIRADELMHRPEEGPHAFDRDACLADIARRILRLGGIAPRKAAPQAAERAAQA